MKFTIKFWIRSVTSSFIIYTMFRDHLDLIPQLNLCLWGAAFGLFWSTFDE